MAIGFCGFFFLVGMFFGIIDPNYSWVLKLSIPFFVALKWISIPVMYVLGVFVTIIYLKNRKSPKIMIYSFGMILLFSALAVEQLGGVSLIEKQIEAKGQSFESCQEVLEKNGFRKVKEYPGIKIFGREIDRVFTFENDAGDHIKLHTDVSGQVDVISTGWVVYFPTAIHANRTHVFLRRRVCRKHFANWLAVRISRLWKFLTRRESAVWKVLRNGRDGKQ